MTHVELVRFRSGRISLPDPEPARRLVEPWIVERRPDWSLVALACDDGGGDVRGLERPSSLTLNKVVGRQIWDLIHRLCDDFGLAVAVSGQRFLVTSTETLNQLPDSARAGSVVCADGGELGRRHEEDWRRVMEGDSGGETGERHIFDADGRRIEGWTPGVQRLLVRWPPSQMADRIPAVDGREADFVALSMVGRLWGNFSAADREFPVPEGLEEAFEDWLAAAWRQWSFAGDWESVIEPLVPFDGSLTSQSPAAMSLAFDLAARHQAAVAPVERMAVSLIHLLDQLRPEIGGDGPEQIGREATELVGSFTDPLVLDLAVGDANRAGRALAGDLDLTAHQDSTARDHRLLVQLAADSGIACRSHPVGSSLSGEVARLVDEARALLTI